METSLVGVGFINICILAALGFELMNSRFARQALLPLESLDYLVCSFSAQVVPT